MGNDKPWDIWVEYCRKVKAWYVEGQKEPWGMNPPTEQIVDASITQDERYRAALAARDTLAGQLCRAREALKVCAPFVSNHVAEEHIEPALSSSAPCPHEVEAKLFKERYELEQIRYEGISSANEELRAEVGRLREAIEWTDLPGGDSHEKDALGWWLFDNVTREDSARTILRKFLAELCRRADAGRGER